MEVAGPLGILDHEDTQSYTLDHEDTELHPGPQKAPAEDADEDTEAQKPSQGQTLFY